MKRPISRLLPIATLLAVTSTTNPRASHTADLGKYFNASVIAWLHAKLAPATR